MDTTEIPPNKRQRASDSTGDPRARSEYWFQDGNVVLQAEDTLFRVYQSILSRQSEIFQDTFSIPQVDNELIEGCPVIHLSDTAEDMSNIISLLYDSNKSLNLHKDFTITVLGSMLRLGRKYVIPHFENKALEALHHDYPTTLKDWDALTLDNRQIKRCGCQTTQVISIAHEFGLLTILPAAYVDYLHKRSMTLIATDDHLPEKARERCLIGNSRILEHLKEKSVDALCPPSIIPSKGCKRQNCEANKWEMIKDLPVWATKESKAIGLFRSKYPPKDTEKMCSKCREEAIELTKQVRSDFWSILPSFFELPAWTDLKDRV